MSKRKMFLNCNLCGRRIIERLPNGLFRFIFGSDPENPGKPPVEMLLHGSVKMRCLRRSCRTRHPDHWNVYNFFPSITSAPVNRSKTEEVVPISQEQAEGSGIINELKTN